ncbi:hypothetical protein VNO77_37055 [Canavalia gladiata]|uniref:Uncharacterized protein n=1 Tax=Canavalia gladiata TaxID=3824 RepID=A0AAN9PUL6_CANGL
MASEQMVRRKNIPSEEHTQDKGKGEREIGQKEKGRELLSDRARSANIAKDKEAEEGRREAQSGGAVQHMGKTKGEEKKGLGEKEKLESRAREVVGREGNKEDKQRSSPIGKVEAEKARTTGKTRDEAQPREKAETKEGGGEEQAREREGANEEKKEQPSLEDISKNRAEAQQKSMDAIASAQERYRRANQALKKDGGEEQAREREGANEEKKEQLSLEDISKNRAEAQQKSMDAIASAQERYRRANQALKKDGGEEQGREREGERADEKGQPNLGDISKNRAEAPQKSMDAIASAQERYQGANQALKKGGGEEQGRERQEKGEEKEQPSLEEISKSRAEAQQKVKERNERAIKEKETQGKDVTKEKDEQGYAGAKDVPKERATKEKELQGKDVTKEKDQQKGQQGHAEAKDVAKEKDATLDEIGKSAAKEKDQQKGQQGYAESKDVGKERDATAETDKSAAKDAEDLKDMGTLAGWSAEHYSAEIIVEAKGVAQNQEYKERPSAKSTPESFQGGEETHGLRGKGVLGAVGETVAEIGGNIMKPAQKVQQHQGEEGRGGGVFNAVGEAIVEIAETTKVIVAGEGETEARTTHEHDHGKQGEFKYD